MATMLTAPVLCISNLSGVASKLRVGRPTCVEIQAAVARHFGVHFSSMTSESRERFYARPRQVAMYLVRDLTGLSLAQIGRRFGGRDHSTIIHGINTVRDRMSDDAELEAAISAIRKGLVYQ